MTCNTPTASRGNVTLEDRRKITVSGVQGMGIATLSNVYVETSLGGLTIKGTELHIQKFSQEEGVLILLGNIDTLLYSESSGKQGFVKRLFK